ncbi:MAG: hypothetical protein MJZ75_03560 [Paludibacteraceae bacterium]|nr:hypothetical protein [Paludibacteraceae bacterium]
MKKNIFCLLAIIVLFAACNRHEDVNNTDAKSIIGKWKLAQLDNQDVLTDNRIIYTFGADGIGSQTLSQDLQGIGEKAWYVQQKLKYNLNGNALHTQWSNSSVVLEWMATVSSINNDMFVTDPSRVFLNTTPMENMPQALWKRIPQDFSTDIIGLWEGTSCTGITYGDANHRWLYLPSGQYFYYSQDSLDGKWTGKWVISENALNEYDVDGDYLACRWKQTADAKEDREFWDISILDNNMNWSALRRDDSGNLFHATFSMRRVSPTADKAQSMLVGKWIAVEEDGTPIVTNRKSVHTFDGNGLVLYTIADTTKTMTEWHNHMEMNYSLQGAYLVESGYDNTGKLVQWRSSLAEMNANEFTSFAFSSSRPVTAEMPYHEIKFRRVNEDYTDAIVGMWEGTSGSGAYGDYHHRWEYLPAGDDGISRFNYYEWINDKWVVSATNDGEYMVDGDWMATRWTNNGVNYEWWDLDIQGDIMTWTGLRDNGETNTFVLQRVK